MKPAQPTENIPGRWMLGPDGTIISEGTFSTREEAIEAAKKFIDQMLASSKSTSVPQ